MAKTNENRRVDLDAKRESNRKHYSATKGAQDHLLVRLNKGERSAIDLAAAAADLSRTAFFQLYLVPICAALTRDRIAALAGLTRSRTISLATAIGLLIDAEMDRPESEVHSIADEKLMDEFESLFEAAPSSPEPR